MKPEIKELGLKALLEKGEIEKFFDVQMKEKDGQAKGQLIGSIARIADMVTQHSQGVFVDEITNRLSKSLIEVAKELSNGLSEDLKGTEADLKAYVDATDDESRSAILSELDRKVNTAEENLRSAIENTLNSALPELAESARLSDDEVAEIVSNASLSVESQMSELIGAYLADNSLTVSEIEGFQAAVTEIVNNRDISDVAADFTRLRNIPNVLQDFLSSGGKFRIRSMIDVKNWDDFQDGYALVWDANDKKLKPAEVSALPSQTGNSGKFLTTDGTTASWATLAGGGDMAAATYDPNTVSGDAFLMTNMNGGNWKVFYSNGTGDVTEVALGAANTVLQSQGTAVAPQFAALTESDISDFGTYLTDITGENLSTLADVTITTIASGELLKWNGSAWVNNTLAEAGIATSAQGALADSALQNVVEDATPQLGGSLDVNGNKIVSTANGNIDIEPNGTGNVLLGNYTFDADQTVGAGQDNYVLTYDNGSGLISLEAAAGGGGGDVTASANITDNAIVRGDGGAKGVQESGWTISDTDALVNNANATGSWALEVAGDTLPASNIVASIATADATGTGLSTYKARGTLASPTATQSGDTLMFNGGRGYGTTAYGSNSKGAFTVKATENWTDTNQGTELTFETTPNGSTTRAEQMQLDDGGLSLTTGNTYQINDVDVLSATTLGSSVVNSSLTSVGTLASGNADAIVSAASTTTAGKVELATTAEVTTGTDNTRAITPSALNGADVTLADLEITGELYADAEVDDGNSGTADTIDWTTGMFHKSTMTGNCTYTFTAPSGPARVQLKLVQDGTGSRTATWPASVKWPGGTAPTLSTAASAIDIITFYYDGTNYFGVDSLNFS